MALSDILAMFQAQKPWEDQVLGAERRFQPGVDPWYQGIMPALRQNSDGLFDAGLSLAASGPQMNESMNPTNVMRSMATGGSMRPADYAWPDIPRYADYATGPGGQGTSQPWTPRAAPRFSQPLSGMGDRPTGGYMRPRRNAF